MRFPAFRTLKLTGLLLLFGFMLVSLSSSIREFIAEQERIDQKIALITEHGSHRVLPGPDAYRFILAAHVANCDKRGAEIELDIFDAAVTEELREERARGEKKDAEAVRILTEFQTNHIIPLRRSFAASYEKHCS